MPIGHGRGQAYDPMVEGKGVDQFVEHYKSVAPRLTSADPLSHRPRPNQLMCLGMCLRKLRFGAQLINRTPCSV